MLNFIFIFRFVFHPIVISICAGMTEKVKVPTGACR